MTVTEPLVVDEDPGERVGQSHTVALVIEVPPVAVSNGWGEVPVGLGRTPHRRRT